MRVERGGTELFKSPIRQILAQCRAFICPIPIAFVEDLGHRSPADIFHQHRLFIRERVPIVVNQRADDLDGFKVLLKLLLWAARAQAVVVSDAIAVKVLLRIRYSVSGGSRM